MTLVHPLFASNDRLQRAARNSPPLRRGDKGPAVALLQQGLVGIGHRLARSTGADGTMDGKFGGETVDAIKAFQRAENLVNARGRGDGVAGDETLHHLDSALARAPGGGRAPALVTPTGPVPQPADPAATVPDQFDIALVTGAGLLGGYQAIADGVHGGLPCRRGRDGNGGVIVSNQCAVRLSLALAACRAGFDFGRGNVELLHSGRGNCGGIAPHITGSRELADYLSSIGFQFTVTEKGRNDAAEGRRLHQRYRGSHGIAFFDALSVGGDSAGNHIDYVRQGVCMNEHFAFAARGEPGTTERYFRQCGDVWFCAVPEG